MDSKLQKKRSFIDRFAKNWVCQVNCVSFFENCNLVGATPTKLKKAARSVEVKWYPGDGQNYDSSEPSNGATFSVLVTDDGKEEILYTRRN